MMLVWIPKEQKIKLDTRSIKFIFLACAIGTKGYWLWDTTNHKIIISLDILFKEDSLQKGKVQLEPINTRFEVKSIQKVQDVQTSEDCKSTKAIGNVEHRDI
jgi:hypothetical protein